MGNQYAEIFSNIDNALAGMSDEQQERSNAFKRCTHTSETTDKDNDAAYFRELIVKSREALETKEKFLMLSRELSLEEFKKEAEDYLDNQIRETYDVVDYAWGDELTIACEKQKRYKMQRERVKMASTNSEVFEAMFR